MPKKKPDLVRRLQVTSVEYIVDQAMLSLPTNLDLADQESRKKVRQWMVQIGASLLHSLVFDLQKGAAKGITQVVDLALDPTYREQVAARKEREMARFEASFHQQNGKRVISKMLSEKEE